MTKRNKSGLFLAGFAALALVAAPAVAWAGGGAGSANNRNPNSVTCKSGKRPANAKLCKENGGKL
jgi:hypothetical protein